MYELWTLLFIVIKILKRMEGITELENKTFVFDHHKTSKEALTKKYF